MSTTDESAVESPLCGPDRQILEARYPMTPTQRGILFQRQYERNSGLYHVQTVLDIECDLDAAAFIESWRRVMARHEPLRTTFGDPPDRGLPEQLVWREVDVPCVFEDCRELSREQQREHLRSYLGDDRAEGFPPERPPLWRVRVVRLAETLHQVVWSLNYIILDGWSQAEVLREVERFYGQLTAGRDLDLQPVQPYQDYLRWLERQDLAAAERYWRETLDRVAPAGPLPVERRQPAEPDGPGQPALVDRDQCALALTESETASLRAAGRAHDLALDTLLLGCWALLLRRYTGSTEIVTGVTATGRPGDPPRDAPGLGRTVGLLINTLPMRVDVPAAWPWPEWMRRLEQRHTEMLSFAYAPLALIQQWSGISAGSTLFEHVLSIEPGCDPDLGSGSQRCLPMVRRQEENHAPYPLNVVVTTGSRLEMTIHFDPARFDHATVERMLGHLRELCLGLVRLPAASLAQLPMVTETERVQLVEAWNATATPYSGDLCIHQLFERRVAQAPHAVAVLFADRGWTYAEVNAHANQIASYLRGLGVGAGTQVAVLLERSIEMIPVLLGVLKAGGAYVPLEASAPVKRRKAIIDSLGITCVVTQRALLASLLSGEDSPAALTDLVCVDSDPEAEPAVPAPGLPGSPHRRVHTAADLARMPVEDLPAVAGPRDLAYIIFTSGSTGTPKGVMVEHHSAVNLIEWVTTTFEVGAADRILFITSLSFDLSVYDIFGILAAGGSIRLASKQDIQEPTRLLDLLAREPITFWDSAPAALMQLVPFLPSGPGASGGVVSHSLRLIFMSGDWIPVSSPDLLRAAFPAVRVVGLGGATEATVWSNFFPIGMVDPAWTSIPYGTPIQNARYYVLDENFLPCPVDVPGNLYIGGVCTSLGYASDPELTAAKYLPSPFGPEPGERIYQTGDLARWRPDGNLEFLGRTDSQVKIRGYRIELGEIDTLAGRHPAVQAAATLVRTDRPGDASLACYLVLDQAAAEAAAGGEKTSLLDDRLEHWQQVYETFDGQAAPRTEDGADYTGWNSSYTGQALGVDEMERWRQDTLALIRSYRPRTVLEIGCGTGLLL
ncbi:MAG: amino acid adenylation domain-containing protein, partial [Micromonosporaceae bacterium]|nr:amino acid adenylation domain-containing protein [Micromonosporaceae bacterium]